MVTPPFLVKRQKKNPNKYAAPFSEILDPALVLVVADGRPGAGLRGGGGLEYLKTALMLNQHAFKKIENRKCRLCYFNFDNETSTVP